MACRQAFTSFGGDSANGESGTWVDESGCTPPAGHETDIRGPHTLDELAEKIPTFILPLAVPGLNGGGNPSKI
mgnify:CR=1 FL=1